MAVGVLEVDAAAAVVGVDLAGLGAARVGPVGQAALADPGRVPLGTWVKLPATESMELVALAGFDFAVIDLEHSAMNLETAFRHIGTALLTGVSPIVRVPSLEGGIAQRILDDFRDFLGKFWLVKPKAASIESLAETLRRAA